MKFYAYTRKIDLPFERALERTRESLQSQGFGILTEIDVQATMKKKLNKEMETYVILGACNPPFAARAIEAEYEIGLLLPCNVIVYQKQKGVFVSTMLPSVGMSFIKNDALQQIAQEVEPRLIAAVNAI
ncbi:ABC transporter ATP-binding protein [Candidatus Peregrinibacteria bacterium CG11_big_fil_rev_8_21_14_0_20_46_8]|nr:MAG: ABC transporter ATP-binding protein [Candidatus Peregrinibacteria bacterium CG11_big_fil_rev_8_21_14_0_20_46_8]